MRTLPALLTFLVLLAGTAQAQHLDSLTQRADALWHEKEYEKAIEAYEVVIREGDHDTEFTPKAYERIAFCLLHLGKREQAMAILDKAIDEYEGHRDILWQLKKAALQIKAHKDRDRPDHARPEDLDDLERRRRDAEQQVKGAEELRRQLEKQREALEKRLAELQRMWKEHGVAEEEIRERVEQVRERHARELEARREIEELERRLAEEGVPPDVARREIEEHRRRIHADLEARWRKGHTDDLADVRREFIHLAERLGIPADQAERFLAEHTRQRSDRPFSFGNAGNEERRRPDDVMRRLEELESKLGHALERLERGFGELEERLRRLENRR